MRQPLLFGINADAGHLDGDLCRLEKLLAYVTSLGYDCVEIPVHGVDALLNGALAQERLEEVKQLLGRYPLRYTVHGPNPLNLMDRKRSAWQFQAFATSLAFTAAIGAPVMVYHAGRYLPEEDFHLPGRREVQADEKARLRQQEKELLQRLGDVAGELGVIIGVENARPYLDGSPYCYAERLDGLGEMVVSIDHSRVRVTLDVGHAYLAAQFYGFDLISAVRGLSALICHLHAHDNFGNACSSLEKKRVELLATGRGDLHLPPGWGELPLGEVMAQLPDYRGAIIQELRPRYLPLAGDSLRHLKDLVGVRASVS